MSKTFSIMSRAVLLCAPLLAIVNCRSLPAVDKTDATHSTPSSSKTVREPDQYSISIYRKFAALQTQYQDLQSNNMDHMSYAIALEALLWHHMDWEGAALIEYELGRVYFYQAISTEGKPNDAHAFYEKSHRHFESGFARLENTPVTGLNTASLERLQREAQENYCWVQVAYLPMKIQSLASRPQQQSNLLRQYRGVFDNNVCDPSMRIEAARLYVITELNDKAVVEPLTDRLIQVTRLRERSTIEAERIALTRILGDGELLLGHPDRAKSLYTQYSDQDIRAHAGELYEAERFIEDKRERLVWVRKEQERQACLTYMEQVTQEKTDSEDPLRQWMLDYIDTFDLMDQGILGTKPIYREGNPNKGVIKYQVSPKLYQARSRVQRLQLSLTASPAALSAQVLAQYKTMLALLQQAIDLRIRGYHVSKLDYRREFEQSDTLEAESIALFSELKYYFFISSKPSPYDACLKEMDKDVAKMDALAE